eukprot:TRINITY_DN6816_c0_g1_i1.p1 TRINITY_DN6816_c0_g1~~TRINITY_DN6816_c0_g1_i1.p1  ORF type:complete len:398 (-),score=53.34 TRINITY_DN6816_c0_g1_i1:87-1280(-)
MGPRSDASAYVLEAYVGGNNDFGRLAAAAAGAGVGAGAPAAAFGPSLGRVEAKKQWWELPVPSSCTKQLVASLGAPSSQASARPTPAASARADQSSGHGLRSEKLTVGIVRGALNRGMGALSARSHSSRSSGSRCRTPLQQLQQSSVCRASTPSSCAGSGVIAAPRQPSSRGSTCERLRFTDPATTQLLAVPSALRGADDCASLLSGSSVLSHATTPSWRSCYGGCERGAGGSSSSSYADGSAGPKDNRSRQREVGSRPSEDALSASSAASGMSRRKPPLPAEARWEKLQSATGPASELRKLAELDSEVGEANAQLVDAFLNVKRRPSPSVSEASSEFTASESFCGSESAVPRRSDRSGAHRSRPGSERSSQRQMHQRPPLGGGLATCIEEVAESTY